MNGVLRPFDNHGHFGLVLLPDELLLSSTYHNETLFEIPLKLALHYADIPGIPPDKTLPVDILFGDGLNVWTYIALISTRVNLNILFLGLLLIFAFMYFIHLQ